jgi:PleD family two-component response regulator
VGDIVLQKVAKRLFELTRKGDYVFPRRRRGVLIFLADAGDKGVPRVAQKIRGRSRSWRFRSRSSRGLKGHRSVGVASSGKYPGRV